VRAAEGARFALAAAGDRRVQAWLEGDLGAASPEGRVGAASALAELGLAQRAAPLLAAPEPRVRLRAASACALPARF
jgi:hypothetical protein